MQWVLVGVLSMVITCVIGCSDLMLCDHGRCSNPLDVHNGHGNCGVCDCSVGYTGSCCTMEINECESNPCQNNGLCVDRVNSYTCTCKTGFIGIHCETNKECHTKPCLNGGICTDDQDHGHTCHCRIGYSGKNCEIGPQIKVSATIILEKEKVITEGAPAVLIPCFAEGIPFPNVTWSTIEGNLPRNVKQIGHYLLFTNVTRDNSGYYLCSATNEKGTDIKDIHVTVNVLRPHIAPVVSAKTPVEVNYYGNASLVCHVSGDPFPNITWSYEHRFVQFSGEVLVINRVTNATAGIYTCTATNDAGSSQAHIMLKAIYDVAKIVTSPLPAVITTGQSKNFSCVATGLPKPKITWTFIPLSQQTSQLPPHTLYKGGSVIQVNNMQQSGHLTCTAKNEFGEDMKTVLVVVKNPQTPGFGR